MSVPKIVGLYGIESSSVSTRYLFKTYGHARAFRHTLPRMSAGAYTYFRKKDRMHVVWVPTPETLAYYTAHAKAQQAPPPQSTAPLAPWTNHMREELG
jgi:hypothetical protein